MSQLSLWLARSSLRVTPLGKDRHGRLYWQLPHVTGVVVEDGGGVGVAQWYHISTLETFQELMVRTYIPTCMCCACVVHKGEGQSAQCLSPTYFCVGLPECNG